MAQGIFIGIGGSGVKSLARMKAKIYESYADKEAFIKDNSFIVIDTEIWSFFFHILYYSYNDLSVSLKSVDCVLRCIYSLVSNLYPV